MYEPLLLMQVPLCSQRFATSHSLKSGQKKNKKKNKKAVNVLLDIAIKMLTSMSLYRSKLCKIKRYIMFTDFAMLSLPTNRTVTLIGTVLINARSIILAQEGHLTFVDI